MNSAPVTFQNPFAPAQPRIDTPPAQHSRPPSVTGAAEQQRVDPEDELSDSREEEASANRQQPRGYTTPVPTVPLQNVGVFTPLYRRSGPQNISEQTLHRVMQCQELTSATRTQNPPHSQQCLGAGCSRRYV